MIDIVKINESIEGESIQGHSRKPLMDRGLCPYKGGHYYRYMASFNVKSQIVSQLSEGVKKIENDAICDLNVELSCDKAFIHSVGDRYRSSVSSNVTATHGSNAWHFPQQTNVKISHAHQEILNAIRKRQLKQLGK